MKKWLVLTIAVLMAPTVHAEGWFEDFFNFSPTWFQVKSVNFGGKNEKKQKAKTTSVQVAKKRKKDTGQTFEFSHIRTTQGKKIIKVRTTTDPEGIKQLQEEAAEKAARKDSVFKKVEVRNLPDGVEITYTKK